MSKRRRCGSGKLEKYAPKSKKIKQMFPSPSKELNDFIDNIDITADSNIFLIESPKPVAKKTRIIQPMKKIVEFVDINPNVNATTCLLKKSHKYQQKMDKEVLNVKVDQDVEKHDSQDSNAELDQDKGFNILKHNMIIQNLKMLKLCKSRGWLDKKKSAELLGRERSKLV